MAISNQTSGIRPGVCTSTTRPTAPYTGQIIYETDTGYLRVWDGANWDYFSPKQDAIPGAWTTFTPSWTNFTVGSATQDFRYTEINKVMTVSGTLTLSSSTMGTAPRFTIPNSRTAIGGSYGWCQVKDSGTANYYGIVYATGTAIYFAMSNVGATYVTLTDISSTVPMTWANNDAIEFTITFPIT